jgi:hypothetical protein
MPQDLGPSGDLGINTSNVADTADASGVTGHETPETRPREQRPRSRIHPTQESLDALEEVLLRFVLPICK